jgi:plasmid stability protein
MRYFLSSRIMRTTIDLDPGVLRDLKGRAAREGKSLGRLASELLSASLTRSPEPEPVAFHWTTRAMTARVDLEDKEAVRRALEEA